MRKTVIPMVALLTFFATFCEADLVGLWHLDGDALDSSGLGNHGTIYYGATYDTGYYGQSLRFDGDDDYVDCGSDASLDLTDGMTIEAWVYLDSYTYYPSFVSKGDVGNYVESYALFHDPYGKLGFLVNSNGTYEGRTVVYGSHIPLQTWTHVAATYDGMTMQIYVNGTPVADTTHTGGVNITGDPVMIGQSYQSDYGPHYSTTIDGLIDEVHIWDGVPCDIMLTSLAMFVMDEVDAGRIDAGLEPSLLAKVNAALAALERDNANDAKVAMNDLKALINQVEAQMDKKITEGTALEIIQNADDIIASLS